MAGRVLLEIVDGPQRGRTIAIERTELFLVGRAEEAHLSFPDDRQFSRHHFILEASPPQCKLRDLGSTNGTAVNGVRVREVMLADGDEISCGQTRIRIWLPTQGPAADDALECAVCASAQPGATRSAAGANERGSLSFICHDCRNRLESEPQPIAGYRILKQLGKGGMGTVHLAQRLPNEQTVALKVIVPESAASDRAVQMFLREIAVLQGLDHARIVRIFDFGVSNGQFFFAMEHVAECDFRALLRDAASRTRLQTACGVMCQVLEALEYAHGRSIVHRDIKPSNFLVSRTDRKLRTKVADFGLAKNFANAGFSGITAEGEVHGTVTYIAPEQVIDCRHAQPSADIYSAAASLYSLLTGENPLPFRKTRDPFGVILDEPAIFLLEKMPDAPAALAHLLDQNLAKDPAQRSPSALEFRKRLLNFAKGRF